ncbi:hypothetical protein C9F11_38360 [Streptomyces sp. YIM 121038]|uniref:hypothetical protein n=1 Tax=Streptomyces sp. YIM 121038 TaxID=2136401 RepID=UPI001110DC94|nr:hypothetical protein [Streptomyces sp. YIM 121038]QCX81255.1 hypothetical protein C9F11_38360 [Streptomyces sp. YIM 121038]
MLSIHIAVPAGDSPHRHAEWRLLQEAHIRRLHLKRPLTPVFTPTQERFRVLAEVLGLDPDADITRDFYKVEVETVPCGEDDHPRGHPDE